MPWPRAGLGPARVEEGQRGAEDGGGDGGAVHGELRLVELEPSLAMHEEGQLAGGDPVLASALAVAEGQLAVHRGEPVVGGAHGVDQPMPGGVLVVVEVALRPLAFRPGIQGIDEHAGDRARTRDLDARLAQVGRHRRHLPTRPCWPRWSADAPAVSPAVSAREHLRPLGHERARAA